MAASLIQLFQGFGEEARKQFQNVMNSRPNWRANQYRNIGYSYIYDGKYKESVNDFKSAFEWYKEQEMKFGSIGAGFELGGRLQLAELGFELNANAEANVQFGVQYTGSDWNTFVTPPELNSSAEFEYFVPTIPTDFVSAFSNLRLEPTLTGFAFAEWEN